MDGAGGGSRDVTSPPGMPGRPPLLRVLTCLSSQDKACAHLRYPTGAGGPALLLGLQGAEQGPQTVSVSDNQSQASLAPRAGPEGRSGQRGRCGEAMN